MQSGSAAGAKLDAIMNSAAVQSSDLTYRLILAPLGARALQSVNHQEFQVTNQSALAVRISSYSLKPFDQCIVSATREVGVVGEEKCTR
jgi:hypothetical protein